MGRKRKVVKIPQYSVNVHLTKYRRVHLKRPRGWATWAFGVGNETKLFRGSYSEAKLRAVKYAANRGISRIYVLP